MKKLKLAITNWYKNKCFFHYPRVISREFNSDEHGRIFMQKIKTRCDNCGKDP
jgi:hypothetical protein